MSDAVLVVFSIWMVVGFPAFWCADSFERGVAWFLFWPAIVFVRALREARKMLEE